jgi:hypothetical protein
MKVRTNRTGATKLKSPTVRTASFMKKIRKRMAAKKERAARKIW